MGRDVCSGGRPGCVQHDCRVYGGYDKDPTYDDVCTGRHRTCEAVRVVWDPSVISYADLLRLLLGRARTGTGHERAAISDHNIAPRFIPV
ncbi:peptide-methionine (S)-S-oxide reductase [Shigella flexneri]